MKEKEEMYHDFIRYIIRPMGTTIIIIVSFWFYILIWSLMLLNWKKGIKAYLGFIKNIMEE